MLLTVSEPVRVGLVGAGPWASIMHGPMLAAGPETRLSGVWARRPEAAAALAADLGTVAAGSFDELLDGCDAVAFAVPPQVQAELGVRAAQAGKALLLEKPIALDLAGAQRLADAVERGRCGQPAGADQALPPAGAGVPRRRGRLPGVRRPVRAT